MRSDVFACSEKPKPASIMVLLDVLLRLSLPYGVLTWNREKNVPNIPWWETLLINSGGRTLTEMAIAASEHEWRRQTQ